MECKAKGCSETKVKVYALFCGIKLAYCEKHNYLFRDIKIINEMAQGKGEQLLKANEIKKQHRKEHREQNWKNAPLI